MAGAILWHSTVLRVLDLDECVSFYQKHFLMTVVKRVEGVKRWAALVTQQQGREPKDVYNRCEGVSLVLRECKDLTSINDGNKEPDRGFGHIAFNCNDVYSVCEELEKNNVKFQKRPNEGRMKGLAFALDPNGYWIEICGRGESNEMKEPFNFSQTMIRVKDPTRSLSFYQDIMSMTLVRHMPCSDFTNYFLATLTYPNLGHPKTPVSPRDPEKAREFVHELWTPCLELTHNHGTEATEGFHYHNGSTGNNKGFSNLSFAVEDVDAFIAHAQKKAQGLFDLQVTRLDNCAQLGLPESVRLINDPDGYRILIFSRSDVL